MGSDFSKLIDWYERTYDGYGDWKEFTDKEISEALDKIADGDGRVSVANRKSEVIGEMAEFFEDDFVESVQTYTQYKKLTSNRVLSSHAEDKMKDRLVDEVSFDADEIRQINSKDKSLAYKIRRSARSNSNDVLDSLSDDELLDDYLSVQRKKGSDYFLSYQDLTTEVNRRGLV